MDNFTSRQKAFIEQMCESEELAAHGFRLLVKRDDLAIYFDALLEAGLFDPRKNPAPVPVAEEGYVRIPYWGALDYLVELAKRSGKQSDLALASKVMDVVRAVSSWRDEKGDPQENYHTSQRFATILGLLPTAVVTDADLQFVSLWLSNRFERLLVSQAIDELVLPHFLASTIVGGWQKALIVLESCTAITWDKEKIFGESSPHTVVEDFWLNRIVTNHASNFGNRVGPEATAMFERRVREVFRSEIHRDHSEIFRPAVEDHYQNHRFRAAENLMVSGLRDVLLAWAEFDLTGARDYVGRLICDELEILRRVGIYAINRKWAVMKPLYQNLLSFNPFNPGHLHELYDLVNEHFDEMGDAEQEQTLKAIHDLPLPTWGDNPLASRKRFQQRWLTALRGKGCEAADEWFAQLEADPEVGPVPEHPDFTSYMTTWQGPGASPFSVAELMGFASENILAEQLNSFEGDTLRGPSVEGLASSVQDAVRSEPQVFIRALPNLVAAKPLFQQAVARGLTDAWRADESVPGKWGDSSWSQVIAFFERLVTSENSWLQQDDEPRNWLVSAIADCLHAGTQNDAHAYPEELLPRTLALLRYLLANAGASAECPDDPMMRALNTPKGRVIDALFSQGLRACRVSDKNIGNHDAAWQEIQPLFGIEIQKCRNENYEFSTLCGAYIAQLDYMSLTWTTEAIPAIFPAEYANNEKCAVAGLAYGAFTKTVYEHLLAGGVIDRGLRYELAGRDARERLLDRIAAAYLWDVESLQSPRFEYLFSSGSIDDLRRITWAFWAARNEQVTELQKERILQFWERCIVFGNGLPSVRAKLFSALSALACYLTDADGRSRELLIAVAPYVHFEHSSYEFIEELLRLVEISPDAVAAVLEVMVTAHTPEYDYNDYLLTLLKTLAEQGKRLEVLRLLEHLRTLPKMQEFFDDLTRRSC